MKSELKNTERPNNLITIESVAENLRRYSDIYQLRKPIYQFAMLTSLRLIWAGQHKNLLDVGGGSGAIAQYIAEFFPVRKVVTIDVEDRFHHGLTIEFRVYNGRVIPFDDKLFEAAMLNNVVHHVPKTSRVALMQEIARVTAGPVYIKDHVSSGKVDNVRLALLDIIGNLPFGGMVRAEYLSMDDWRTLARESGYAIADVRGGRYRTGLSGAVFPNRLETVMRWERD